MKKITARLAAEIAENFELQDESRLLLTPEQTPAEFFQLLMSKEYFQDAVTFMAHALPAREAVWWACICARYHLENAEVKYQLGQKAAESWVYEPSEKNRRICEKYAEEGDYATPASWACAAAFWSGGSITKEGDPALEAPAHIYAHAVSGAVLLSVGWKMSETDDAETRYRRYLEHGINIAEGGNG